MIALRRGLRTQVDERLREVDQPPEWVEDHRAKALGYLAGRAGFDSGAAGPRWLRGLTRRYGMRWSRRTGARW